MGPSQDQRKNITMPCSDHAIHLVMYGATALLPRVLLVFSRRRQRIKRLTYLDCENDSRVRMCVELRCDGQRAQEFSRQLLRIVEVIEARVETIELDSDVGSIELAAV